MSGKAVRNIFTLQGGLFFLSAADLGRLAQTCCHFGLKHETEQFFNQPSGLPICEAAIRRLLVTRSKALGLDPTAAVAFPRGRSAGPALLSLENATPELKIENGELKRDRKNSLTKLVVPFGVTRIGSFAFEDCPGLAEVHLPDSLIHIGNHAFRDCSGLTNVHLPDSLTHIGSYTFCGCSSLTNVHLPDSLTHIGSYAFAGCSGLTNVHLPDSVVHIGDHAIERCG